jgi:hypothetical protein
MHTGIDCVLLTISAMGAEKEDMSVGWSNCRGFGPQKAEE